MTNAIPFILLFIVGAIVVFFQEKVVRDIAEERDDLQDAIDRRDAYDEEEADEDNEPDPDEIKVGSRVVVELGGFIVHGVINSLYSAQYSGAGNNVDTQYKFLIQIGTGEDEIFVPHYNASYDMKLWVEAPVATPASSPVEAATPVISSATEAAVEKVVASLGAAVSDLTAAVEAKVEPTV